MHSSAPPSEPSKPGPSTHAACWTIAGRILHDPRQGGSATIDLDAPGDGIRLEADRLLGLDLRPRWRLADHWVRGADVTAVYESNDARHLRATAMWRLHPCGGGARGWQAVISAQTSMLQSESVLSVTSSLAAAPVGDLLWGECSGGTVRWQTAPRDGASCVLLRRCGGPHGDAPSVLVAGHPGEVRRVEARSVAGRTEIACWLFSAELEKGVLLRSRVLAAIGPGPDDEAWATAAATAFAASPPMLTT